MKTFSSSAAALASLTRNGYVRVAEVRAADSTRYGFSRTREGRVESAVLTVFAADLTTVRYL